MGKDSKIEWTDHTFNGWIGCTHVSPACDHCYAEISTAARSTAARIGAPLWGPGAKRHRTSEAYWRQPLLWDRAAAAAGVRPRVFCMSLADVFDNEVPAQWRSDLFQLIEKTPNLDWLLLTKRIGNVRAMTAGVSSWPNVWLGATVVNQEEADRDIPKLLATPARVRFLSIEPMLGPIDLEYPEGVYPSGPARCCDGTECSCMGRPADPPLIYGINWVILGGESGHHARPMHPSWPRSIRDQCAAWRVPFLFKQWGEWEIASAANGHNGGVMPETGERYTWVIENGKTSNPSCPQDRDGWAMAKVGKAKAGRLLDGVTHDGFPGPAS